MKFTHDILDYTSLKSPDKIAVTTVNQSVTYEEVRKYSLKLADFLSIMGVKKEDRILLYMPNQIELVYLLFAISRIGAIAVVVDPKTPTAKLKYIIDDCKPVLMIKNSTLIEFEGVREIDINNIMTNLSDNIDKFDLIIENQPENPFLLIYTSGSTGDPKAVISSHLNVIFCTEAISKRLNIKSNDVIGNILPLSFDYGLYQVFLCFYNYATLALGEAENAGVQLVNFLKKHQVTFFPSMPHITMGLIKILPRLIGKVPLRAITNTGEKFPNTYLKELKELIPSCEIYLMYGLTECKRVSILLPSELKDKSNSVGKPLDNVSCFIVDDNDINLPPGEVGELVVEGKNVMQGYWDNSKLSNEKFKKGTQSSNTRVYTGDYFKMDDEGYLYFVGRNDSLYKQNGFRISSLEIENAAYQIEGVELAALIKPNEKYQYPTLYIKSKKKINDLKLSLTTYIEEYKIPQEIIYLDSFPITSNGKIDKKKLEFLRWTNFYE